MSIRTQFYELWQFLGAYFTDSHLLGLTDEEVVDGYRSDFNDDESLQKGYDQTVKEIDLVLQDFERYWKDIGLETNRYFGNSQDAEKWILQVQKWLKEKR